MIEELKVLEFAMLVWCVASVACMVWGTLTQSFRTIFMGGLSFTIGASVLILIIMLLIGGD